MIILSVLTLLSFVTTAESQEFPDWGKFISAFEKATQGNGITVVNGTTTITQIIGGKEYNATVPKGASYMLHTEKNTFNGTTVSIVKLTINNRTAVYKTANGKVTATDGKGNPLSADDDFFGVNGNPPKVTDGPETPASPEAKTEAPSGTEPTAEPETKIETPSAPVTSKTPEKKVETTVP